MKLTRRVVLAIALFSLILSSGCRRNGAVYHMREDIDFSYFKKVAVLPLDNLTNDRAASDIMRYLIISELLASGLVDVVIPGEAITAMTDLDIKSVASLNENQIRALGKALKVEGIIFGTVQQYGEIRTGNTSAPEVAITLMMADAGSGNIVWSITKSRGGADFMARHFGARSETISETAQALTRETVRTLGK